MESNKSYILCIKKRITKNVYNNIMNSINITDTILMNSANSKKSDPHTLLISLSDKKKTYREVINMLLYQIVAFIIHGEI